MIFVTGCIIIIMVNMFVVCDMPVSLFSSVLCRNIYLLLSYYVLFIFMFNIQLIFIFCLSSLNL